jgi:UDP-N-acetylglucosamine---dolichyl-phosphate N-acetylglucosaminyltransferase
MALDEKLTVVVPAYNEAGTIGSVIRDLKSVTNSIVVVDDGSKDETARIAEGEGAMVIKHLINRGLGAGLQTGFKKALSLGANYIVTFDADGQHRVLDVQRLLAVLKSGEVDLVIGSRNYSRMPFLRKLYNISADLLGFFVFGVYVHDTQSGLRAFKRATLLKMPPLGDRMEVASEIVGNTRRLNLRLKEVPIEPIYTDYSLSKGQSFVTGLKTLVSLIFNRLSR